jgi:hypothetical protein
MDDPSYIVHDCKSGLLCHSDQIDYGWGCCNHPPRWLAGWLAGRPAVAETKRTTGRGAGVEAENIMNLCSLTGLLPL